MTWSVALEILASLFAIGREVAQAISDGDMKRVEEILPGTLQSEIRLAALRAKAAEKFRA